MSQAPQDNPYETPASSATPVGGSEPFTGKIDYLAIFRYIMTSPNWMMNVLFATLCQLVPVAGPIVLLGYIFEGVEGLVRDPRRQYPDFDFNRLSPYFMRGIWPLLVALVAMLVMLPIFAIFSFVFVVLPLILLGNSRSDAAGILIIIIFFFAWVIMMVLMLVMQTIMIPLVLGAGLSQDFGIAMNFARVRDFFGRVWKEAILLQVVYMLASLGLGLVGFCAFVVGAYVAAGFCALAMTHLYYQLYALYLLRGGSPIPLKEEVKPVF